MKSQDVCLIIKSQPLARESADVFTYTVVVDEKPMAKNILKDYIYNLYIDNKSSEENGKIAEEYKTHTAHTEANAQREVLVSSLPPA